jgi:hypothetical protein
VVSRVATSITPAASRSAAIGRRRFPIQARNRVITFGWTPNAHSYQQLEAIRFLPTRPAAGVAWNDR